MTAVVNLWWASRPFSGCYIRFYEPTGGRITIDGQYRPVTLESLRASLASSLDTVLFNDTIGYNIGYGRTRHARNRGPPPPPTIHDFVAMLPLRATIDGRRARPPIGGEKQRVASRSHPAQDPPILISTGDQRAPTAAPGGDQRHAPARVAPPSSSKSPPVDRDRRRPDIVPGAGWPARTHPCSATALCQHQPRQQSERETRKRRRAERRDKFAPGRLWRKWASPNARRSSP